MKRFTREEKNHLQNLYDFFVNNDKLMIMKTFAQHRGSNAFEHTLRVTKKAYSLAKRFHKKINFDDLITGAMLHDYCLYDWRVEHNLAGHAKRHPKLAAQNAIRDFDVNNKVRNIILSHMWPLNFTVFHNCKEARLVSIADKIVAFCEAFTSKRWKNKHRKDYYPILLKLENN